MFHSPQLRRRCSSDVRLGAPLWFLLMVAARVVVGQQVPAGNTTAVPSPVPGNDDPLGMISPGDSPFFRDLNPFENARAASLVASVLSGFSGIPLTTCHVWRSVTILSLCRPPPTSALSPSQMPISMPIGNNPLTKYSAGPAVFALVIVLVIALLTACASLILTKAKGGSWRKMLIIGRYPQHLLFPFFFFLQTGVSSAVTVVTIDTDAGRRAGAGILLVAWAALCVAPMVYVYKAVPLGATYVKKYREISDEAEIEKELFRRLRQLEKENEEHELAAERLREEAEREKRRLAGIQEAGVEVGSVNGSFTGSNDALETIVTGSTLTKYPGEPGTQARTKSFFGGADESLSLFKSLRSFIPEAEEDTLMRHTDKYIDAALRADDAEKERLRRATNLVYSKMLASQIQATAFEDSAVQQTLTGRDRWEDRKPASGEPGMSAADQAATQTMTSAEEQDEDDVMSLVQQAALAAYIPAPIADYLSSKGTRQVKSRTGFLNMWGGFFKFFKENAYWYMCIEFATSFGAAVAQGWTPTDGNSSSCFGPASVLLVVNATYFTATVMLRPYLIPIDAGLTYLSSLLQLLASCLTVVASVNVDSASAVGANALAVCCIYLYVLKALLDVFLVVAPLFFSKEVPWPTSKLTQYYFDTARQNSDAGFYEQRTKMREHLLRTHRRKDSSGNEESSSTKSPRRSRAGSLSSTRGGGNGGSTEGRPRAGSGGSSDELHAPRSTSPQREGTPPASDTAAGRGVSPTSSSSQRKIDVRFVDTVENEAIRYRSIGGRRNAYVTSRGVPEALHPFTLCPLPPLIPLPQRDVNSLTRKQRKARLVQERTAAMFTESKWLQALKQVDTDGADDSTEPDAQGDDFLASPSWSKALQHLQDENRRQTQARKQRETRRLQESLLQNSMVMGRSVGPSVGTRSMLSSDERTSRGEAESAAHKARKGDGELNDADRAFLDLEDDLDTLTDMFVVTKGTFRTLDKLHRARQVEPQSQQQTAVHEDLSLRSSVGRDGPGENSNPRPVVLTAPPVMSHELPEERAAALVNDRVLALLRSQQNHLMQRNEDDRFARGDHISTASYARRGSPVLRSATQELHASYGEGGPAATSRRRGVQFVEPPSRFASQASDLFRSNNSSPEVDL